MVTQEELISTCYEPRPEREGIKTAVPDDVQHRTLAMNRDLKEKGLRQPYEIEFD